MDTGSVDKMADNVMPACQMRVHERLKSDRRDSEIDYVLHCQGRSLPGSDSGVRSFNHGRRLPPSLPLLASRLRTRTHDLV